MISSSFPSAFAAKMCFAQTFSHAASGVFTNALIKKNFHREKHSKSFERTKKLSKFLCILSLETYF